MPNGGMSEQLTGGVDVYTCCKTERCETVPPGVESDRLCKEKHAGED